MKKKICLKLSCINISKFLADHIVGERHTNTHRKIFGAIIMLVGILIIKYSITSHIPGLDILGETVGTSIHGVGLIPYISGMEKL